MKKIALLLVLVLICFSVGCAAGGQTEHYEEGTEYFSDDYKYILLRDGTAEITGYDVTAARRIDVLIIPEELGKHKVSSIGEQAFRECKSLKEITIPDSVISVGANPFWGCFSLTQIKVSQKHPTLVVIDGVLFDKEAKRLVCYPMAFKADSYRIPQGISSVGEYAFYYSKSLAEIIIPDSVTHIENGAFSECSSLTGLDLPDGITYIGDRAFLGCSALANIAIPDSVTYIGEYAFYRSDSLTLTVDRDSCAAEYAKANDIEYTYPDANDWLNS